MNDYFLLAFNNLRRRGLRSWLTVTGIFIGIAAVVALISLGQGLQYAIQQQFEQLGSDKIIIQTKTFGPPGSSVISLTEKDVKTIEDVRGIEWAIGLVSKSSQILFKNQLEVGFVNAINPEDIKLVENIQGFKVAEGRTLERKSKFEIVVGYNHIYGDIWDKELRIGDSLEIFGKKFKIVGVSEKVGNPIDDSSVLVPKETLKEILNLGDEESQILAKVEADSDPAKIAGRVKEDLRKSRNEKKGQESFQIQTSDQLLSSFTNIFGIVQAVLIGIAGISLLVGGIGIMNTMYTSVLERTKEVGTMKAIGAKNSDIMLIFLFEAGFLGMVGGIIGIAIGYGLGKGVEYVAVNSLGTDLLRAIFPWYLILGALLFSFLIGTLSGILPAFQASKLRPADTLRFE